MLSPGDAAYKGLDVHPVKTADSEIIRYVAGKWQTSADARKNLESVRKKFPDAYVVKVTGSKVVREK